MISSVAKVIAGLGLAFFTLLNPSVAATPTSGSTVSFSGALSQDPCQLTSGASQINFACPDKGGVQTQQISVQQVARGEVALPGVEKVSLTYLNPQKSQAVVRVDYN